MNKLLRAGEIKKEHNKLSKEVEQIDKFIQLTLDTDSKVKLKARLSKAKKLEIQDDNSCSGFIILTTTSKKKFHVWNIDNNFSCTESVIMFTALLEYKKLQMKNLVKEFKELNLSLKL